MTFLELDTVDLITLTVTLLAGLCGLVYYLYTRHSSGSQWYPNIPVLAPGSALDQVVHKEKQRGMLKAHRELGDIFQMQIQGLGPVIYLSNADFLSHYFTGKAFTKNDSTWGGDLEGVVDLKNLVQPLLTRTFLDLDGKAWQAVRKDINPFFASPSVVPMTIGYVSDAVDKWGPRYSCDLMTEMHEVFQHMVCDLLSGGVKLDKEGFQAYCGAIHYFVERNLSPDAEPFNHKDVVEIKKLLPHAYRTVAAVKDSIKKDDGLVHPKSLVYLMAKAGCYDDEEIANTFINLVIAGAESPAVSAAKTFARVLCDPELTAKVIEEVDTVCGSRHITAADIDNLKLLELVVMEGMRHYMPTAVLSRKVVADTQLCGYPIPKGATVQVNVNAVHMDAKNWPKPEEFNPNHFASGRWHPYGWVPFGGGPRGCPGKKATVIMCKTLFAVILQRYTASYSGTWKDLDTIVANKFSGWAPEGVNVEFLRREVGVVDPSRDVGGHYD